MSHTIYVTRIIMRPLSTLFGLQCMLPMKKSVTFTGACANEIIRRNNSESEVMLEYWIYITRICRTTLKTLDNIPVKLPDTHNHQNHQNKLKVDNGLQSIKKRCREETTPIPIDLFS